VRDRPTGGNRAAGSPKRPEAGVHPG
jgi:hypothetical protein